MILLYTVVFSAKLNFGLFIADCLYLLLYLANCLITLRCIDVLRFFIDMGRICELLYRSHYLPHLTSYSGSEGSERRNNTETERNPWPPEFSRADLSLTPSLSFCFDGG